jgi:hypothetical protein
VWNVTSVRRALGYVVTSEEKLLKEFVCFVEAQMVAGPIRAQTALDWACMPSPRMCCNFVVEPKAGVDDRQFSSPPQTDRE